MNTAPELKIQKTTQAQSKINKIYLSKGLERNDTDFAFVDGTYLFAVEEDASLPSGTAALSRVQREFLDKAVQGGKIEVDFIDRRYISAISVIRLEFEMLNLSTIEIDANILKLRMLEVYRGFPFNKGQRFYIELSTQDTPSIILVVTATEIVTEDKAFYGILAEPSEISVSSSSSRLFITNNNALLRRNMSFEQLGIGGLKKEFEDMFRRAFVQRLYEPGVMKSLGISHVKGILLYGPPGTGKTLIARQLGSLLNARQPKVVNGPEILNKYVGESEANIRNLFKDAEEEFRLKKEESQLHIIIFDEIDAICKRRGSSGSAGVGDQVVNQLLSKIDGVEALENILVIGMTNRLDMIDEALLRPGRFEIQLEIGLPDEQSRYEIFMIHTKSMSGNNYMDIGVDIKKMAVLSKNYTGAEIAAVVRGAISFALERNAKLDERIEETREGKQLDKASPSAGEIKVTMSDMLASLEETRPAFGVNEEDFSVFDKVFYETSTVLKTIDMGKTMLDKLRKTNLYNTNSLLLYGATGAGKTSLAVRIALKSQFPFVKLISPRQLVGLAEYEKVNYIKDRFKDAYKSEEACIILDDLESLIEFVNIGPRFTNSILQALKVFVKAEDRHKLFIFGTTTAPDVMMESGLFESFGEVLEIGPCTEEDYRLLCAQNPAFESIRYEEPVVIKKLLGMLPEPDSSTK